MQGLGLRGPPPERAVVVLTRSVGRYWTPSPPSWTTLALTLESRSQIPQSLSLITCGPDHCLLYHGAEWLSAVAAAYYCRSVRFGRSCVCYYRRRYSRSSRSWAEQTERWRIECFVRLVLCVLSCVVLFAAANVRPLPHFFWDRGTPWSFWMWCFILCDVFVLSRWFIPGDGYPRKVSVTKEVLLDRWCDDVLCYWTWSNIL